MEDCNRCRCTENLLPGCTKRFCNIPENTLPVKGEPVETRKSSNEGGDNVNFPGVGDSNRGQPITQCTDSKGIKRNPGDSWKEDCNTCGCSNDGHVMCTLILCPSSSSLSSSSSSSSSSSLSHCTDSQGNKKELGEAWKEDCNTCRCGSNG